MTQKRVAITGAQASANAMRQINPEVVAAYPITPQTDVMHAFAKFVADGKVDTELILVESEHSAMSACVGAAAGGVRAMTASAANGIALMWEIIYIAASNRLPITMNVVNRALSGPINIHCDHSDSMGCRDAGWLQFYSESAQEAYENTLMAQKVSEHPQVLLPSMVCQDGFITSHAVEVVDLLDDATVKNFIGNYTPKYPLLNYEQPMTSGPVDFYDYYFEHKKQQMDAMEKAKTVIHNVFNEFEKITGTHYDFFEGYQLEDAETVLVAASSSAGTIRVVVDKLRSQGKKVGLLKIRVFRPFNNELITKKLENAKAVAILDRSATFGGFGGPLFTEIRSAFYEKTKKPTIINYIYGLGGRDLTVELVQQAYSELEKPKQGPTVRTLGVRE